MFFKLCCELCCVLYDLLTQLKQLKRYLLVANKIILEFKLSLLKTIPMSFWSFSEKCIVHRMCFSNYWFSFIYDFWFIWNIRRVKWLNLTTLSRLNIQIFCYALNEKCIPALVSTNRKKSLLEMIINFWGVPSKGGKFHQTTLLLLYSPHVLWKEITTKKEWIRNFTSWNIDEPRALQDRLLFWC